MLIIKKVFSIIVIILVFCFITTLAFAEVPEFNNTKDIANYISNELYKFSPEMSFVSTLDHTNHYEVWMEIYNQIDTEARLLYKEEKITYTKNNEKTLIIIKIEYFITKEQYNEALLIVKNEAKNLRGKTQVETVLNVYNFVIYEMNYELTDARFVANIYCATKNKIGVCSTYSIYMKKLLDELDIQCNYVRGCIIADDIHHMWNVVKVNNKWYYLDATFGEGINPDYTYFLINSDLITKERKDLISPEGIDIAKTSFKFNNLVKKKMTKKRYNITEEQNDQNYKIQIKDNTSGEIIINFSIVPIDPNEKKVDTHIYTREEMQEKIDQKRRYQRDLEILGLPPDFK